jgi:hypothetical protein
MSPASSPRAADAAPSARRRTRPPSRTGSAESRKSWEALDLQCATLEASSYTSGSVTAWESENDEPIAELMEDIFNALDRLERRDMGKRAGRSALSV